VIRGVAAAGSADEKGEGRADALATGPQNVGDVAFDSGVEGVGFCFDLSLHFGQLMLNEFEREFEGGGGFGLCEKFHNRRLVGKWPDVKPGEWDEEETEEGLGRMRANLEIP
jgi:hypothetical protein